MVNLMSTELGMRSKIALMVGSLTVGCASVGGGGGGVGAMAYAVPSGNPLTYERGDTLLVSIEAPGLGAIDLSFDQTMTLALSFGPTASGMEVTADFQDYALSIDNPMSGVQRADEDDLEGPLVFTVGPTGDASIVQAPEVSGVATQAFRAASMANEMFPRLPGRAVSQGDMWVDTVTYSDDTGSGSIFSEWIGTMTVAGDTVADGVTVTKVTVEAEVLVDVDVDMGGMLVTQSMGGTERGFFLWDASRGVPVYQESRRAFEGTVEMDMAPAPMDLVASGTVRMRIQN
jgi:hypothetical protein